LRLIEFASAEEQIALFKLITDKVWQSLADQKRQAEELAAQRRRAQAVTGNVRAKRAPPAKPVKHIKPEPVPPPSTDLPDADTEPEELTSTEPNSTSQAAITDKDTDLDDERIALYPQKSGDLRELIR